MADFKIRATDEIEIDSGPGGVRISQTIGDEVGIVWVSDCQLGQFIQYLQQIKDDVEWGDR